MSLAFVHGRWRLSDLDTIDDSETATVIYSPNIAGMKPTILVNSFLGVLLIYTAGHSISKLT